MAARQLERESNWIDHSQESVRTVLSEEQAIQSSARLDVAVFASAATVVAVFAYLICAAIAALVSVDVLIALFEPWFHGVSLQALRPRNPVFRPDMLVFGLINLMIVVWLATATTAWLYNAWADRA